MININSKSWNDVQIEDVITALENSDESFYYELKRDEEKNEKFIKEVCAFANTYGGYIFLGVSDDKEIMGCKTWTEQRIHNVMHDMISPIPGFEVKKLLYDNKVILIVRIDEGYETPYVTKSGKIYERISSGSFPINDSNRLTHLYNKRENKLKEIEKMISITPIKSDAINNLYGYIDMGFSLNWANKDAISQRFNELNLEEVVKNFDFGVNYNVCKIGGNIKVSIFDLNSSKQLPAHANNFMEIFQDGSMKLRTLITNNDPNDPSVNMLNNVAAISLLRAFYDELIGDIVEKELLSYHKYEALITFKQFYPLYYYSDEMLVESPDKIDEAKKINESIRHHQEIFGKDLVITDSRIPPSGLYYIDRNIMKKYDLDISRESLIGSLFSCEYVWIGNYDNNMDIN